MATGAVARGTHVRIPLARPFLAALGDDALVERVRAGDEVAFEVVYDRYHSGLLAFCRHMLGSADEAEDALQQVFVSAHADLLRSPREITLKPWLYAIARNRCVSMLRARRERPAEIADVPTERLSEQVERRMELRALLADLHDLPEEQRAALVLAEIGDLSHDEIGQVVGCERNKVKALIFQARSALVDARKAREMPCAEIRQQLATLRGGALRRAELRRHLRVCPGCTEFRDEVRKQRAMMALLLPVVPSAGLKRSVLAAAGIGSGGAGAGGAGVAAGLAAKGGVAKLVTAGVLGTLALGGGMVLEKEGDLPFAGSHSSTPPTASRTAAPKAQVRSVVTHDPSPVIAPKHHTVSLPAPAVHNRHRTHAPSTHVKAHQAPKTVKAPSGGYVNGMNHSAAGRQHQKVTPPAHPPTSRKPATPPGQSGSPGQSGTHAPTAVVPPKPQGQDPPGPPLDTPGASVRPQVPAPAASH